MNAFPQTCITPQEQIDILTRMVAALEGRIAALESRPVTITVRQSARGIGLDIAGSLLTVASPDAALPGPFSKRWGVVE